MYIKTTNSTNTLLKQLAAEGNPTEFIYAGYQTAGRGQTGNSWESEADKNLICSILLPPDKDLYFLNIAVSVAIIRLIDEQLTIKWPNDIYFGDKKLAGMLIQNTIEGRMMGVSIIGIGLNVNQIEFSKDIPNPISLKMITGEEYDLENLLNQLIINI